MADESAIPRDALERVLARATELQGVSGEPSEAISESRLMEVAREVGIDAQHLRQALAEERARIAFDAPDSGPILDALGTALVDAQRVVPGEGINFTPTLPNGLVPLADNIEVVPLVAGHDRDQLQINEPRA